MHFKQFLAEQQTLNFKHFKPQIEKWIESVKNKSTTDRGLIQQAPFYDIITNSISKVGDAAALGISPDFQKIWKDTLSKAPWDTDGVWSQMNFNSTKKKKVDSKTHNFYISVGRSSENDVERFFKALPDLAKQLSSLADSEGIAISFKTHRLLDAFVNHNDSLKVYFYDEAAKEKIAQEVRAWAKAAKITLGARSHEHGTDIESAEGLNRKIDTGSHGQRIADKLSLSLLELIRKNGDAYTTEQYYQWIAKYAVSLIKSVK